MYFSAIKLEMILFYIIYRLVACIMLVVFILLVLICRLNIFAFYILLRLTFILMFFRMSTMNIRLFFSGNFHRSTYSGGDSMLVPGVELDEFSYTVLMEYVKDYLHFSEIGGVYVSKGKKGGWKLITADRDVLGHLADCLADDEVNFYIDNHIDTGIEPLPQMQPHVIVRPRKNIVQGR